MLNFLSIVFHGFLKSLEESGRRRAQYYMTNYTEKGLWK